MYLNLNLNSNHIYILSVSLYVYNFLSVLCVSFFFRILVHWNTFLQSAFCRCTLRFMGIRFNITKKLCWWNYHIVFLPLIRITIISVLQTSLGAHIVLTYVWIHVLFYSIIFSQIMIFFNCISFVNSGYFVSFLLFSSLFIDFVFKVCLCNNIDQKREKNFIIYECDWYNGLSVCFFIYMYFYRQKMWVILCGWLQFVKCFSFFWFFFFPFKISMVWNVYDAFGCKKPLFFLIGVLRETRRTHTLSLSLSLKASIS